MKADVVYMVFGSHLYGLDTPSSDKDYKGVYKPEFKSMILHNYPKSIVTSTGSEFSKNGAKDVDKEIIALPYFIKNACNGETFALDMVHCKNPISTSDEWKFISDNRDKFYSKNMKAYIGYVKKQAAKYGLKGTRLACIKSAMKSLEPFVRAGVERIDFVKDDLYVGEYASWVKYKGKGAGAVEQDFYEVNGKKYQSTNSAEYVYDQISKMWNGYGERAKQAEQNNGIDWKAVSHAFRAGFQARDIYKFGDFEYPLKETDFIMDVKLGNLDYTTVVAPALEALVDEVNELCDKSKLPKSVDTKFWEEFILSLYL